MSYKAMLAVKAELLSSLHVALCVCHGVTVSVVLF